MSSIRTISHDAVILNRVIKPNRADLPPEVARAFLQFEFDQKDCERMHELALKAQRGALLTDEKDELDSYRRIGYFLDLMRSKARKALKKAKR
jgi:uncharacterized protein YnzC (UPF0291/DUF896 family)